MPVRITHIGGPTTLIEVGGWRLLTDPTLDAPGRTYSFGFGTSSRKTIGPALSAEALLPIDVVLLTHDHHGDNLDDAGRAFLPRASSVVTTAAGARRLGGSTRGLTNWDSTVYESLARAPLEITATPCRHGPPLSKPIVGDVIGFAIRCEETLIWVSGDTVLYDGVREVIDRLDVDIALMHIGGVRFPITGPFRYTMTAEEAVTLCEQLDPSVIIPVHYDGWSHFVEPRASAERAFANAPPGIRERVRWLVPGEPATITLATITL